MRLPLALRHLGAVLAGTLLLVASSQAMPTASPGPTMADVSLPRPSAHIERHLTHISPTVHLRDRHQPAPGHALWPHQQ